MMDRPDEIVGRTGDDSKGANPFPSIRMPPVLPDARQGERLTAFLPDGIRSLGLHTFNRLPLEEAIHRDKASASFVGVAEGRKRGDGFCLCVDGLPSTIRKLTPMRDQAPPEPIQSPFP